MAIPFRANIDFLWLEAFNFKLQNLSADPSGAGAGSLYFNTADGSIRGHNGASFFVVPFVGPALAVALTVGSAGAAGSSNYAARVDHVHAMPGLATTAAAGFMSAADKTLLSAATASATLSTLVLRDAAARFQASDPVAAQDVATKAYVDAAINGFDPKGSVKARTTANITLTNPGTAIFDGVTLNNGDLLLVANQTTPAQNGIYVFNGSAATLTRATNADAWGELVSAYTVVEQGTLYADTGWLCTADAGGTLGTTAVNWIAFGNVTSYTASNDPGITGIGVYGSTVGNQFRFRGILAGSNKISVTLTGNDIVVDLVPGNVDLATLGGTLGILHGGTGATTALAARGNLGAIGVFSTTIGDGVATTFVVTHNLNTKRVKVTAQEAAGQEREVMVQWSPTTVNSITIGPVLPVPTAGELVITVQG